LKQNYSHEIVMFIYQQGKIVLLLFFYFSLAINVV